MLETIRGRRQKTGLITLVLALIFFAGWYRSITKLDLLDFSFKSVEFNVLSIDQRLWIIVGFGGFNGPFVDWASRDLEGLKHFRSEGNDFGTQFDPQHYADTAWRLDWIGFHLGRGTLKKVAYRPLGSVFTCTISHWYIISPLTLISAYLLHWKSRQQPKPPNHVPLS